MTPLEFTGAAFGASIAAGLLGSLLGLGGGIIVVPALTLLLGVDIRYAIGASIVAVIATSSGASAAYVKEHLSNIRVGMLLEVATTIGALSGATLAGVVSERWLYIIFALVLAYTVLAMLRRKPHDPSAAEPPDRLADALALHATYHDHALGCDVPYRVTRTKLGLAISCGAGLLSGLLGVGGGVLKVPAMNIGMRIPLKVASATSNFMIGVTAAASAGVYFSRGDINPFIAAPVAVGVLAGSMLGARFLSRIHSTYLQIAFLVVLGWIAVQMLLKGIQ